MKLPVGLLILSHETAGWVTHIKVMKLPVGLFILSHETAGGIVHIKS